MLRRRSPGWIRELPDRTLHGMAGRMSRENAQGDLTRRQDWLWGCIISELEYRRRLHLRTGTVLDACTCWLCLPTSYLFDPGDL